MRVVSTRRRAVNVAVAALLLAATVTATGSVAATDPAAPARGATDQAPALHGLNRIDAAHPARAYVRIPRPVTLHQQRHGYGFIRGLTLHGAGRMYGIALTDPHARRGFVAMHYNPCFERGCARAMRGYHSAQMAMTWDIAAMEKQIDARSLRLPAGRYIMSVFADGAPVHVQWRIDGLGGTARLRLHTAQNVTVTTPAQQAPAAGPVRTESEFAGTGTLRTDIVVLAYVDAVAKSSAVVDNSTWCIEPVGPPDNGPRPVCAPGTGVGGTFINPAAVTVSRKGMGFGLCMMAGPGTAGRYYQSVDDKGVELISDAHASMLWADAGWQTQ